VDETEDVSFSVIGSHRSSWINGPLNVLLFLLPRELTMIRCQPVASHHSLALTLSSSTNWLPTEV